MTLGVIVLNFGEPPEPTHDQVVAFLERIFYANADLEGLTDPEARRRRSRELAERRASGLVEEYGLIGRSPMNEQADSQAEALARELADRGVSASVHSAFQFTPPLVPETIEKLRAEEVDVLVALPIYPLCGPSTNVAALNDVRSALDEAGWSVELRGISGWHRHPLYLALRADAIADTARKAGLDLSDPETRVVFSAHGTPKKYLDAGSRYQEYVEELCEEMARRLGLDVYELGYQNHTNRGIEWTQPDIEEVIRTVEARRVIVDPVSFMHEQSETLAELDHELREEAESAGLEFHRVPVPHADPRFAAVLADLVALRVSNEADPSLPRLAPCRCRPAKDTFCMNALPAGPVERGAT